MGKHSGNRNFRYRLTDREDSVARLPHPASVAAGVRAAGRSVAGTGWRTGQELASIATHVARYPGGVLAETVRFAETRTRLDCLPPVTRGLLLHDLHAAGTPVVLVHGIVDNRSAFAVIRRALARRGFGHVSTMNYSPLTVNVATAAERLGRHIEQVCERTGYDTVNVIGHSLGGIVARYYVQRRGGHRRVDTLVTLGSPHAGTALAHLLPVGVAGQLRPAGQVLRDLAAPTRARTRVVSIYSDRDELLVPCSTGRLAHPDLAVTNVALHGVGHLALLVDRGAVSACVQALVPVPPRSRSAREPRTSRAPGATGPASPPPPPSRHPRAAVAG